MNDAVKEPKVLIIDDEADIRHLLTMSLLQMGIEVTSAKDVADAKQQLQNASFDFCLTDLKLPDGSGMDIVRHCKEAYPAMPIAVITAYGNTDTAVEAMKLGAFDFLAKPIELTHLRQLLKHAFKFSENQTGQEKKLKAPMFAGKSELISDFKHQFDKIKQTNAPIVISGDKGTQKEQLAKLLHQESSLADFQEIYFDCNELEQEVTNNPLFERLNQQKSIVEQAHQSSLIVSNLHQLSNVCQKKLLQILENKSLYCEDTGKDIQIDIRLIVCSDRPLDDFVKSQQLREDLFFRLSVICFKIPTIEQRREDMESLVESYRHLICPDKKLAKNALAALLEHQYHYNYRELENIFRKAALSAEADIIEATDLLFSTSEHFIKANESASQLHISSRGDLNLDEYIEQVERQEITAALDQTHWNRTEAAKLLGVSFRTIRYKIKKLGID